MEIKSKTGRAVEEWMDSEIIEGTREAVGPLAVGLMKALVNLGVGWVDQYFAAIMGRS
jgi:hypothetical protein